VTDAAERCSVLAGVAGEPLSGTASSGRRRWLLVEQPGPWGRDALVESGVDGRVARELQRTAKRLGVHVQLIRGRGGGARDGRRVCYLASTERDAVWLERVELDLGEPEQLLKLDLDALAAGRPTGAGTLVQVPLYLVCTHGRRDPCCALRGRPVLDAAAGVAGERVWETSHVGGHRFAGNLVCFPDGLYLGRLGRDEGARAVELYDQGRILLAHYRGRSSDHWAAQVADWWVRDRTGLDRVGDLTVSEVVEDAEQATVRLAAPDGRRWRVPVRRVPLGRALPQSCGEAPEDPGVGRVVEAAVEAAVEAVSRRRS